MVTEINLKKGNLAKKGLVGFSWTTLFFGFFVPIFRGDFTWAIIMVILEAITCGASNIVMAFFYNNKIYTAKLLENGWEPADEYSKKILIEKGMITE